MDKLSSVTAKAPSPARFSPNASAGKSATASPSRTLSTAPANTWEFNLDGIYTNSNVGGDESQFWLQWEYFDESIPAVIKDQPGWFVVKLDSPDDAVSRRRCDRQRFLQFRHRNQNRNRIRLPAGFVKQLGNIQFLILTIGSVVFFTLLLVTGNTMAISVRERTGELAVLKAIGYPDHFVLIFVLTEAMVVAVIGGLIGLGLAMLAIPAVGIALSGLLPPLLLSATALSGGLLFAVGVGVASGLLPGIGAMRLRVVDALRRV